MNDLQSYYQHYRANITYDNNFEAAHGWETPDGQVDCPILDSPFMIKCTTSDGAVYDSEQVWLTKFFGTLHPRNNSGQLSGALINFDQTEFNSAQALMDTNGYVFVPTACQQGKRCRLVVALHGCNQTQAQIGIEWVTEAGIDEWADTNDIIVLYPYNVQVATTSGDDDQGCWDWWGYTGSNYPYKSGLQMASIKAMVDRITGR